MPVFTKAIGLSVALIMLSVGVANATHLEDRSTYSAPQVKTAIRVDGIADDAAWKAAEWREIKYRWLGPEYTAEDFNGRFKVVWTPERIYLLAKIEDDILYDAHRDPLVQYWDDDSLEIFIDEDYSGGEHHFSHNAFAYHMSLDNRAIDIGSDGKAHDYTDHTESRWRQEGECRDPCGRSPLSATSHARQPSLYPYTSRCCIRLM